MEQVVKAVRKRERAHLRTSIHLDRLTDTRIDKLRREADPKKIPLSKVDFVRAVVKYLDNHRKVLKEVVIGN